MTKPQKNVLGEDLEECSNDPLTGWFRDGCCNTDKNDRGLVGVIVIIPQNHPWSTTPAGLNRSRIVRSQSHLYP